MKATTTLTFLVIMIMASFAVCAGDLFSSFDLYWGDYNDYATRKGYVTDTTANFGEGIGTISSIADGSDYQPMAIDLDNDGELEVLGTDGNFIKIWHKAGNTLQLENEYNVFHPPDQQFQEAFNYDGDDYKEFIGVWNNTLIVYEYNGTALNTELLHELNETASTGMACFDILGSVTRCVIGTDACSVKSWDLQTNIMYNRSVGVFGGDCFSLEPGQNGQIPPAADYDQDGQIEIFFMVERYLVVFDAEDLSLDSHWTGSYATGVDDLSGAGKISTIQPYNYDGAGYTEILATTHTYIGGNYANHNYITIRRADGSVAYSGTIGEDTTYPDGSNFCTYSVDQPKVSNFIGSDSVKEACLTFRRDCPSGTDLSVLQCWSANNLTKVFEISNTFYPSDYARRTHFIGAPVTDADEYSFTSKLDLIIGGTVMTINNDLSYSLINLTTPYTAWSSNHPIFSDLDGDGSGEIVVMGTNLVSMASDSHVNLNPQLNGRVFGVTPFSLSAPICLGSTITFSATKCVSDGDVCHYTDEITDSERLISFCSGTFFNGTFTTGQQEVNCYLNTTGTKTVRVYVQDSTHQNNYTEYQSFTVTVTNGTATQTCNIPSSVGEETGNIPPSTEQIDTDGLEDMVDQISGGSTAFDFLLVLFLSMAVIGTLIKYDIKEPSLWAFSITGLWLILSVGFGMISIIWVIVIASLGALWAFVGKRVMAV